MLKITNLGSGRVRLWVPTLISQCEIVLPNNDCKTVCCALGYTLLACLTGLTNLLVQCSCEAAELSVSELAWWAQLSFASPVVSLGLTLGKHHLSRKPYLWKLFVNEKFFKKIITPNQHNNLPSKFLLVEALLNRTSLSS